MSYSIILTPKFKKEAKRLVKKYPSLRNELAALEEILAEDPHHGTSLGQNTFKIRVSIKSKGKGKSGGARVITYLITEEAEIYLLTIYDKSEIENVDNKTLKELIRQVEK